MGYYQQDKRTNAVPLLSQATLSRPLESSHDKTPAGDLFSALRERGVGRQTGAEPSLLDTTVKRDLGIIASLAAERKRMLAQLS